jgi:hypothetical protein
MTVVAWALPGPTTTRCCTADSAGQAVVSAQVADRRPRRRLAVKMTVRAHWAGAENPDPVHDVAPAVDVFPLWAVDPEQCRGKWLSQMNPNSVPSYLVSALSVGPF